MKSKLFGCAVLLAAMMGAGLQGSASKAGSDQLPGCSGHDEKLICGGAVGCDQKSEMIYASGTKKDPGGGEYKNALRAKDGNNVYQTFNCPGACIGGGTKVNMQCVDLPIQGD